MWIDFIRNDPGRWFRLAAVKIRCYFGFWIDAGQWQFAEQFGFINDAAPPLVTLSLLSVLAVAGMVLTVPYCRKLMLLYAILASNLCLQIVLYVEPRFRMQIAPVLIVFAASPVYVIERLSTYIRPRHGLGAREKGK